MLQAKVRKEGTAAAEALARVKESAQRERISLRDEHQVALLLTHVGDRANLVLLFMRMNYE